MSNIRKTERWQKVNKAPPVLSIEKKQAKWALWER